MTLLNLDGPSGRKARRTLKVLLGIGSLAAVVVLSSTLAANISINSGPVEFGQGVAETVSCSGETELMVTPESEFINVNDDGSFYLKSVSVSNIPTSCYGKDFTIKAYGNSGNTPLVLFNTSSSASVYNNEGTFELGAGVGVASISSGSETFTVTFESPVASSSSIYSITLESKDHIAPTTSFCASLNGTLNSFTCTVDSGSTSITSNLIIPRGYTLVISGEETTIWNNGTLTNNGIIDSNGTLQNNGTFTNDGIYYNNSPTGTINNNTPAGIINNGGHILSNHLLNNHHIFNNNNNSDGVYLGSFGVINNHVIYQWNGPAATGWGTTNEVLP